MRIIHHLRHKVSAFPDMKTNPKSDQNNTLDNLLNFIQKLKETPQHSMAFLPETGEVQIWFMLLDCKQCMVSMNNTIGSCSICIQYFVSCQELAEDTTSHTFDPDGFLALVNSFLTKEDIEEQIKLREQEMLREALKKAHYLLPRTCGNSWEKCEYCKSEESRYLILHRIGT